VGKKCRVRLILLVDVVVVTKLVLWLTRGYAAKSLVQSGLIRFESGVTKSLRFILPKKCKQRVDERQSFSSVHARHFIDRFRLVFTLFIISLIRSRNIDFLGGKSMLIESVYKCQCAIKMIASTLRV